MTVVEFDEKAIGKLATDRRVAAMLGDIAEQIARDARPAVWPQLALWTRYGVGGRTRDASGRFMSGRGAYAQVRMRGSGALLLEFGSERRPARAPLRNALHRKRHL